MTASPPTLRQWVRDHDEKWLFVVLYLGLAVGLSILVSLFWLGVVAALHLGLELVRQAHYREGATNIFLHALWEVKLDIGLILLALMLVLYIEVVLGLLGVQSAARAAAVSRAGARVGTRAAAWERNLRTFLLTVDEMVRVGYAGLMLRRKRIEGRLQADGAAGPMDGPAEGTSDPALERLDSARTSSEGAADPPSGTPDPVGKTPRGTPEPTGATVDATAASPHDSPEESVGESPDAAEGVPGETPDPAGGPIPPIWRARWKVVDRIGLGLVGVGVVLLLAAPYLTPHDWNTAIAALAEELRPFP